MEDSSKSFISYYNIYRGEGIGYKRSKIYSFFKAVISYIFNKALPVSLSNNDKLNFERNLNKDLTSKFDVCYAPGTILFKPKDLTGGLEHS